MFRVGSGKLLGRVANAIGVFVVMAIDDEVAIFVGVKRIKAVIDLEAIEALVVMINPMVPHLAEELWQGLGHPTMLTEQSWPEADPALLVDDTLTIAIQINGKLRSSIEMPRDTDKDGVEAAALADDRIRNLLDGSTPRKVIVVPNRIVNIVV